MSTYYLKYRPQNLEQLDLASVRESLTKIVSSGSIPHAFLFSGPKGIGKTSAARILAKIINCQNRKGKSVKPCNRCSQCTSIVKGSNIDVIELDAASHRGIDDIRALRDAVKLAPAAARSKVYIIDEAHMLTTEASNALLKTLEEPPDHVVFILATTNPEKLIGTIRSRTTNIVFKKASNEEVVRSLKRVISGEKLKIDKESLELIAGASDGSMRDAQKILQELVQQKIKLNRNSVEDYLNQNASIFTEKLLGFLAIKDTKSALSQVNGAVSSGLSVRDFLGQILADLRSALLASLGMEGNPLDGFEKEDILTLINLFSDAAAAVPTSYIEQLPVEIAVIKWCESESSTNKNVKSDLPDEVMLKEPKSKKAAKRNLERGSANMSALKQIPDTAWESILSKVRPINKSTEALLRATKPLGINGKTFDLGVYYTFHKERLEEHSHRCILEDAIGSVFGTTIRLRCIMTDPPKKKTVSSSYTNGNGVVNGHVESENPKDTPLAKTPLTEEEDRDIIRIAEEVFGS